MKTLFLSLLVLTLQKTFWTSREREKLRRGFTVWSKPKRKDISTSTSVKVYSLDLVAQSEWNVRATQPSC